MQEFTSLRRHQPRGRNHIDMKQVRVQAYKSGRKYSARLDYDVNIEHTFYCRPVRVV